METRSTENAFTRASQFLIALMLILAPFPFGSVQDLWVFVLEAGVCLLLLIWVASQIAAGEVSLVKTRLTWPLAALTAYLLLTLLPLNRRILAALSADTASFYASAAEVARDAGGKVGQGFPISLTPFDTEGEILKYVCYVLFFFLALNWLRYSRVYLNLYRAIIFSGAVVAAFGLAQSAWSNGKIYWTFQSGSGSPFGPFVSHNHFAGYIELALGLALGMLLVEIRQFKEKAAFPGVAGYFAWLLHKDGSRAWMIFAAVFLMLVSLMASLSRGGMLSIAAASALFGLRALTIRRKEEGETPRTKSGRTLRLLAGAGLASVLVLMMIWVWTPYARTRWSNLYDSSLRFRLSIWNDSLAALSDFPLTGTGLGSFRTVFPHYVSAPVASEVTHAENEYLQWTLETGAVGLILLAIAGIALASQIYFRLSGRRDYRARYLAFGALFSLLCIAFHNWGDFNMHIPSNALTTTAVIVLCLVAINFHRGKHGDRFLLASVHLPVRSIGGVSVLSMSLVLAGLVAQRSWARYESLKSVQGWVKDHPQLPRTVPDQETLAPLSRAQRYSPDNDEAIFLQASVFESAASARGFLQLFKKNEMLDQAAELLSGAIQLKPAEARYWAALGRVEMARRRADFAERAFQHAVKLAPANGVIHRDFGIALLVAGRPVDAAAQFTIARNFAADLPLNEMLEALGSRTNDTHVWQSIVRYHPTDLRVFAAFLNARGLTSMADQYRTEADQLDRARPKPQ